MFDGVVIAESDDVTVVEGRASFPIADVDLDQLVPKPASTRCFWTGRATDHHLLGDDGGARNAAFGYEHPRPLARRPVGDRITFRQDVDVSRG